MGWDTDWLTSIGTVGSAWAAIYLGVIQPRRRRPTLTVGEVDSVIALTGMPSGGDVETTWLRLPVTTANGRGSAENVEAVIRSVRSGPSVEALRDRGLSGFSLTWTGVEGGRALIPPGLTRLLNIGYLIPASYGDRNTPGFHLDLVGGAPRGDRGRWDAPLAEIEVDVAGSNADAVRLGVLVDLTGGVLDGKRF
jgi:hypothetical protein